MNKIFKITLFVVLFLFWGGCSSENLNIPIVSKSKLDNPILANGVINMPKDAAKVILATTARILKSDKKITDIVFQQAFRLKLIDARLFSFKNAILISYENRGKYRKLHADIFLKDSIGRSLAYDLSASYSVVKNRIEVLNFVLKNKYTDVKDSVCFILPADIYLKLNKRTFPKNFYKLYRFVAKNAVTVEQASKYTRKSRWAIVVFVLNRMSKSATLTLGISEKTDSYDNGYTADTKYINYSGWRVGVILGNFHLMKPSSMRKLYAKLIFKPGKESKQSIFFKKQKVIGLYRIH
ncbi:MAG: hypothetical protein L3J44_02050 [Campylobacteraceae bacterium]|nr:hypothetical protein [Campylobacteraceae bacterium]